MPYGQLWAASWYRSPALRKTPGLWGHCDRVATALPSRCAPGTTEGHPTSPGEELIRQRRNKWKRERQASPLRTSLCQLLWVLQGAAPATQRMSLD